MDTIQTLPIEVISKILEYDNISVQDIVNFSLTCKQFYYNIIKCNDHLWAKKFSQRWPHTTMNYNTIMNVDFYHFTIADVRSGIQLSKKIFQYVSHMSEKYFYRDDRYENQHIFMDDLDQLITRDTEINQHINFFFLADEFIRFIYKQNPRESDLTERYYIIQLFQCLNRHMLKSRLQEWMEKDSLHQRLEDIIPIILEWYHPDKFFFLHINKFIDNIVQKVLKFLKNENPAHPILSLSPEQFSIWRHNNIEENYWNENEARLIKFILDQTILNFSSNEVDSPWIKLNQIDMFDLYWYKLADRKRDYKRMFLIILYTCVGRRLGLYFEISTHFSQFTTEDIHLTWKPKKCLENKECFIINWKCDRFNSKIIHEIQDSREIHSELIIEKCQMVPNPTALVLGMINRVLMKILGYYSLWPMDAVSIVCHNMSLSLRYYNVLTTCRLDEICERRSPELKFAVGLIVKHKHVCIDEGYKNSTVIGVIIGWHNTCQIERFRHPEAYCTPYHIKDEYIKLYNIEDWKSQPHYVLLVDNDLCYVPQCAITSICTSSKWINNSEIGKYFCKLEDTHYEPNKMLQKHYPDDIAVLRRIVFSNSMINNIKINKGSSTLKINSEDILNNNYEQNEIDMKD